MNKEIMNTNKLYEAAEEMVLEVDRLHPYIWQFYKKNKYGVLVACVVMYNRHIKYYELVANNDRRTLYYGLSIDDLINEMKEFYRRNEIIIPKETK